MENNILLKLIRIKLNDDLKKPILTSKERALMIKEYVTISNKSYRALEVELGISAGTISQYVKLSSSSASCVKEMRGEDEFNFYSVIDKISNFLDKNKNINITLEQQVKIKKLVLKLLRVANIKVSERT